MAHSNIIAITSTFAEQAALPEDTIERRFRAGMLAVMQNNIWLLDENEMFTAATVGVMSLYPEGGPERKQIDESLELLLGIGEAFASGHVLSADKTQRLAEIKNPLPLMKWWHETKMFVAA